VRSFFVVKIAHSGIFCLRLFVQNSIQQRRVDLETAVVVDVAQCRNLFIKWLTRERVLPIMSASADFGDHRLLLPVLAEICNRSRACASRFSLELKSWSTKSSLTRIVQPKDAL
jgi:hypothetical protein